EPDKQLSALAVRLHRDTRYEYAVAGFRHPRPETGSPGLSEQDPSLRRPSRRGDSARQVTARVKAWARNLRPLMVRVISGVLLLGLYGIYVILLIAGSIALWEFRGLSDRWGYPAPSWLLYPLGLFFALSGTALKAVPLDVVLSVALIAGLSVFLVLPGRREGLGRWAMGLAGAIYVGLPFNYYLLLYENARHASGLAWLLLLLVTVVLTDSTPPSIAPR